MKTLNKMRSIPQVAEGTVVTEVDTEAILMNVEQGIYYGLDEIGTFIWKYIENGSTLEELMQKFLTEYQVEKSVFTQDINAFIEDLNLKGLVVGRWG